MTKRSQILFSQGGKGGVGKTTVIAALTAWIRTKGFDPILLDFDNENRDKSSFQSFYPEALKIDIRAADSLDKVFHFLETPGTIVIADQGAGSGAETFSWFDRTAEIVREFADVTSIGIREISLLSGVCCCDFSSAGGRTGLSLKGPSEPAHSIGRSSKPNGSALRRTARLKNRYTLGGAILIP